MALFDSGTPLANVASSDTFLTWRTRTNQINTQAAGLASNNTFTGTLNTFINAAAFNGPVTAPSVAANTITKGGSGVLVSADIGSTVQGYDATTLKSADIGSTVQAYDAGLAYLDGLNFTDESTFKAGVNLEIGTDVQAYDAGLAYLDGLNFTDETTFKAGVNLEIGTDVQAEISGATLTNVTSADDDKILIQDTSDSNNLKTVTKSDILSGITTDPTLGTLTQTFTIPNEQALITLSSAPTGQPVVSATKDVSQTGVDNTYLSVNSTAENYVRTTSAGVTANTLSFAGFGGLGTTITSSATLTSTTIGIATKGGVRFSSNGSIFWIWENTQGDIVSYNLSTPWDITTATAGTAKNSGFALNGTGFTFSADDSKVFVLEEASGNTIAEYTMSTPGNISTASATANSTYSGLTANTTFAARDIEFSTDGTRMYILEAGTSAAPDTKRILEYSVSIPYDIASTVTLTNEFSVTSEMVSPYAFAFNDTGNILIVADNGTGLYEYNLTTGFDLSTISYTGNAIDVASDMDDIRGVDLRSNGSGSPSIFFDNDNVNTLYAYNADGAVKLSTGTWDSTYAGRQIELDAGGYFGITDTLGQIAKLNVITAPTSYDNVAPGNWDVFAVAYDSQIDDTLTTTSSKITLTLDDYTVENTFAGTLDNAFTITEARFNNSGSKLFLSAFGVASANSVLQEYALPTPYNLGSASLTPTTEIANIGFTVPSALANDQIYSFDFNEDGSVLYAMDINGLIERWNLSTPFDLSTYTVSGTLTLPTDVTLNLVRQMTFENNGNLLFVVMNNNASTIVKYGLIVPYDPSTAYYIQDIQTDTYIALSNENKGGGLAFNRSGTRMFLGGSRNPALHEFSLSTAYDLTTLTEVGIVQNVVNKEFFGLTLEGNRLYIPDETSGDAIIQATLTSGVQPIGFFAAHTTASIDTTGWTDINSITVNASDGNGNTSVAISTDGRSTWSIIDNTNGTRDIVRNNSGTWQYNSANNYGQVAWVNTTTNDQVSALEEAVGYANNVVLSTGVYTGNRLQVSGVEGNPRGFTFNNDGTKLFVIGIAGDDVNEYALSTAYDINTATFTAVSASLAVNSPNPTDILFNSDGTKMFILDSGYQVDEYTLSVGFDITSTITFVDGFLITGTTPTPTAMTFNNDGTKMYFTDSNNDRVDEYTLTAYDTSSLSFSQSFTLSEIVTAGGTPQGISFNSDGTYMFISALAVDAFYLYSLSSAFDISTATYTGETLNIASTTAIPAQISADRDGYLYVLDTNGTDEGIEEYDISYRPNEMSYKKLNNITDANHYTLGTKLDIAVIFENKTNTGFSSTFSDVTINYDAATLEESAIVGTDYKWDYPASDKVRITALAPNTLKVRVV